MGKNKNIFITSTGTNIGKTYCTVEILKEMNKVVLNPESGQLASLHEGEGRLPRIDNIISAIKEMLSIKQPLKNKNILIKQGLTSLQKRFEGVSDLNFMYKSAYKNSNIQFNKKFF